MLAIASAISSSSIDNPLECKGFPAISQLRQYVKKSTVAAEPVSNGSTARLQYRINIRLGIQALSYLPWRLAGVNTIANLGVCKLLHIERITPFIRNRDGLAGFALHIALDSGNFFTSRYQTKTSEIKAIPDKFVA